MRSVAATTLRIIQALLPALEDEASLLRLEGESSFEKATASLVKVRASLIPRLSDGDSYCDVNERW